MALTTLYTTMVWNDCDFFISAQRKVGEDGIILLLNLIRDNT